MTAPQGGARMPASPAPDRTRAAAALWAHAAGEPQVRPEG